MPTETICISNQHFIPTSSPSLNYRYLYLILTAKNCLGDPRLVYTLQAFWSERFMSMTSLLFSSSAGSTGLVAGRNQITSFSVKEFSSIRIYAFVRPQTSQLTVYLINPDL